MECNRCYTSLEVGDHGLGLCPLQPRRHAVNGIVTDGIPGGMMVAHAVCWPDGSPRRFDSKSDLKRALNEAGFTTVGDTNKPYRVNWSGRKNDGSHR